VTRCICLLNDVPNVHVRTTAILIVVQYRSQVGRITDQADTPWLRNELLGRGILGVLESYARVGY
jgi:hypothetical protein